MIRPALCLALLPLGLSCTGDIGAAGGDPPDVPDGPDAPVSCEGGPLPAEMPLARLAMAEYNSALAALVGSDVLTSAQAELDALPVDAAEEGESFERTDQRTSAQHIGGYYAVADAIASRLGTSAEARRAVVGDCAADALDAACFERFAGEFMRRAFRRAPTGEETTRARALLDEFAGFEALHALVFTTLMAPDFLYRFENRGEAESNSIRLSAYELATRLSFHFWGEPPDDLLLAAAESGALLGEAGFEEQVTRLFESEKTDATILHFFDEWLHLERGDFGDSPRLALLSDGINTDGLGAEMREEVLDLLRFHLSADEGWRDVLLSDRSFARSERLAEIYNVEAWDGESEPPRADHPPADRGRHGS